MPNFRHRICRQSAFVIGHGKCCNVAAAFHVCHTLTSACTIQCHLPLSLPPVQSIACLRCAIGRPLADPQASLAVTDSCTILDHKTGPAGSKANIAVRMARLPCTLACCCGSVDCCCLTAFTTTVLATSKQLSAVRISLPNLAHIVVLKMSQLSRNIGTRNAHLRLLFALVMACT